MIDTLEVACFQPGDIFQLASIEPGRGRIRCESFTDPARAEGWVLGQQERNVYLCANPLKEHLNRKAKESDIKVARLVLFDVDPDGEDRTPAFKVADEARAFIKEHTGYSPPLIDSGRGFQLWLRVDEAMTKAERRHLVLGLGEKFSQPGATVDSTYDACRLMRLPGTVNHKTGERAKVYNGPRST